MRIDLEARTCQFIGNALQEDPVLEAPAAQDGAPNPGPFADRGRRPHDRAHDRRMKSSSEDVGRLSREPFLRDFPDSGEEIEDYNAVFFLDGKGEDTSDGARGRGLKLHGGLALEVHGAPDVEDRRHTIEDPAEARRDGTVEPFLHDHSERPPESIIRYDAESSGDCPPFFPEGAPQEIGRAPPRLVNGGLATRKAERGKVAGPLKGDLIGHEKLSPQIVPSVP